MMLLRCIEASALFLGVENCRMACKFCFPIHHFMQPMCMQQVCEMVVKAFHFARGNSASGWRGGEEEEGNEIEKAK